MVIAILKGKRKLNFQRLLIELLILVCYWFVEKLFFMVFVNMKITKRGMVHHPSAWMILFLILAWWNLGYYYIAYPLLLIALLGIGLVVKQVVAQHEFLYSQFWPTFWNLGCGVTIISYVVSIFCHNLPTP